METADRVLVQRFVRDGDGEAFATLMNQYADMVFGTCRRVLGNDDQAADATQETFFQFLKDAGRVQGSLGGWLHQVATRRAVDLVRQETARRRREQAYATDVLPQAETWEEIAPLWRTSRIGQRHGRPGGSSAHPNEFQLWRVSQFRGRQRHQPRPLGAQTVIPHYL